METKFRNGKKNSRNIFNESEFKVIPDLYKAISEITTHITAAGTLRMNIIDRVTFQTHKTHKNIYFPTTILICLTSHYTTAYY